MDLVLRLCSEFVGAASAQKSLQVSEVKEDGQIPSLNKETNPWSLHVLRDISRPSRSNASTDPVESDNPNMHEQRMGGAFVSLSLLHLDRRLDEPMRINARTATAWELDITSQLHIPWVWGIRLTAKLEEVHQPRWRYQATASLQLSKALRLAKRTWSGVVACRPKRLLIIVYLVSLHSSPDPGKLADELALAL